MEEVAQYDLREPEILRAIISSLNDENAQIRHQAIGVLASQRQVNTDILNALITQCESSDIQTKQKAIDALGNLGILSPQALDILIRALTDSEDIIVAVAAHSLLDWDKELKE